MELWLGTSGYVYSDWVGPFYPPRMQSKAMLPFYAERFPLVELNFTYYQVPRPRQLARLAASVPADFQFIVKAHRSLTHERNLNTTAAFRDQLEPLKQSGQLMNVLCQFPQRFHFTRPNLHWLEMVHTHFEGLPLAMEFRHRSW